MGFFIPVEPLDFIGSLWEWMKMSNELLGLEVLAVSGVDTGGVGGGEVRALFLNLAAILASSPPQSLYSQCPRLPSSMNFCLFSQGSLFNTRTIENN